ncbi:MAG: DciA family protein [Acidiferrobacteraceae bacterium]
MGAIKVNTYLVGLRVRHFAHADARVFALLMDAWGRCVPQPLSLRTRPSHFKGGWVLVDADSSIWLARLRNQTPTLLAALKREPGLAEIEGFRARVRPATLAGPARPTPRRFSLSARAAGALEALARDTGDPGLRDALGRLLRKSGRHP